MENILLTFGWLLLILLFIVSTLLLSVEKATTGENGKSDVNTLGRSIIVGILVISTILITLCIIHTHHVNLN